MKTIKSIKWNGQELTLFLHWFGSYVVRYENKVTGEYNGSQIKEESVALQCFDEHATRMGESQ